MVKSDLRTAAKAAPIAWRRDAGLTDYATAVAAMEARVRAIAEGEAAELVWLVEHPPIYTAGTSARPEDLLQARFPVHRTGRGGQFTYHGPGQRVAYVLLDVGGRFGDVRAFVGALEDWLIAALARLGVSGERRAGRIGVWVALPGRGPGAEAKIAAIGVRLRRWVSFHGVALNVATDLSDYSGIVPCGITEHGVTSLADLGRPAAMATVDAALRAAFEEAFGPTVDEAPAAGETVMPASA